MFVNAAVGQFIQAVYAWPWVENSHEFDYLVFVFNKYIYKYVTFSIHKDDLFIVFIETGVKGHAKVGPELFSSRL